MEAPGRQVVAPRSLIDENRSPLLARAIAEDWIIVTSTADNFRRLGARTPAHPGPAVTLDAAGGARQRLGAVDRKPSGDGETEPL
jgi:hypothetical protein